MVSLAAPTVEGDTEKKEETQMQPMEAQRQHVLTIIESAQRAGRNENEIVEIVDRYFGRGQARVHGLEAERGRIRRLLDRRIGKAA